MKRLTPDEIDQFFAYHTDHGAEARRLCTTAKIATTYAAQIECLQHARDLRPLTSVAE